MLPFNTLRLHSQSALTKSDGAFFKIAFTKDGLLLYSNLNNAMFLLMHKDMSTSAHRLLVGSVEKIRFSNADDPVCLDEDRRVNSRAAFPWRL